MAGYASARSGLARTSRNHKSAFRATEIVTFLDIDRESFIVSGASRLRGRHQRRRRHGRNAFVQRMRQWTFGRCGGAAQC